MSRYKISSAPDMLVGCTWRAPSGQLFLPLAHTIPWYFQAALSKAYQGIEQGMNADYDFLVKAIGAVVDTPGNNTTLVQIQWPDGRYLSNPGLSVFDFIGTGLRGWGLDNPELIPRGAKVKLNVDNSGNSLSVVNLALFFEGVLLVPMEAAA